MVYKNLYTVHIIPPPPTQTHTSISGYCFMLGHNLQAMCWLYYLYMLVYGALYIYIARSMILSWLLYTHAHSIGFQNVAIGNLTYLSA